MIDWFHLPTTCQLSHALRDIDEKGTSWKTSEPQGPISLFWIVTFEHVKGPSALDFSFVILRMVAETYIWTHDQPLFVSLICWTRQEEKLTSGYKIGHIPRADSDYFHQIQYWLLHLYIYPPRSYSHWSTISSLDKADQGTHLNIPQFDAGEFIICRSDRWGDIESIDHYHSSSLIGRISLCWDFLLSVDISPDLLTDSLDSRRYSSKSVASYMSRRHIAVIHTPLHHFWVHFASHRSMLSWAYKLHYRWEGGRVWLSCIWKGVAFWVDCV